MRSYASYRLALEHVTRQCAGQPYAITQERDATALAQTLKDTDTTGADAATLIEASHAGDHYPIVYVVSDEWRFTIGYIVYHASGRCDALAID